jgi:hypothetical protein
MGNILILRIYFIRLVFFISFLCKKKPQITQIISQITLCQSVPKSVISVVKNDIQTKNIYSIPANAGNKDQRVATAIE